MSTTLSRIQSIVENNCLTMGLKREFIIKGKDYAGMVYEHEQCFATAVTNGVSLAEELAKSSPPKRITTR